MAAKWENKGRGRWEYTGHGWGVFSVRKGGKKWHAFSEPFSSAPVGIGEFDSRPEAQRFVESHVAKFRKTNPKKRRTRRASPAQLKARAKFAAMARARAGKKRRAKAPAKKRARNPGGRLTGFQVAALRKGKLYYLSGIGLSDNREAASLFGSLKTARKIAGQVRGVAGKFGITKVAVVTKHDAPAEIQRFFSGKV